MLIYCFDCAIENMGVCVIEFNEQWRTQLYAYNDELISKMHKLKGLGNDNVDSVSLALQEIQEVLKNIDQTLKTILTIKYMNVIDLISERYVDEVDILERTMYVKKFMSIIDQTLINMTPDVVLIEYQMNMNDITRLISAQIAYHYMTDCNVILEHKKKDLRKTRKKNVNFIPRKGVFTYGMQNEYALIQNVKEENEVKESVKDTCKPRIELISCALKNRFHIAPDGQYQHFIGRYSTSYLDNKHHTAYNFLYFVQKFGGDIEKRAIESMRNKCDDIADAFMMGFSWLKKLCLL